MMAATGLLQVPVAAVAPVQLSPPPGPGLAVCTSSHLSRIRPVFASTK